MNSTINLNNGIILDISTSNINVPAFYIKIKELGSLLYELKLSAADMGCIITGLNSIYDSEFDTSLSDHIIIKGNGYNKYTIIINSDIRLILTNEHIGMLVDVFTNSIVSKK